jgi:hypothetical protein
MAELDGMSHEYRFRIADSYTRETLPMGRLAQYLDAFARLLGEPGEVHLDAVRDGSAVLVAKIDEPARPKVGDRLDRVRRGEGIKDAVKAFGDLDELLRMDNATGQLTDANSEVIIPFPGRDRVAPLSFGPFKQDGSLEGQVIRVGGTDDTMPVHLRDDKVIHSGLFASPEIARRISQHFLGAVLRVHGTGTWFRGADGGWELRSFRITDFEVLDEAPLAEVVSSVRAVAGSKWNEVADPVQHLLRERLGGGGDA